MYTRHCSITPLQYTHQVLHTVTITSSILSCRSLSSSFRKASNFSCRQYQSHITTFPHTDISIPILLSRKVQVNLHEKYRSTELSPSPYIPLCVLVGLVLICDHLPGWTLSGKSSHSMQHSTAESRAQPACSRHSTAEHSRASMQHSTAESRAHTIKFKDQVVIVGSSEVCNSPSSGQL